MNFGAAAAICSLQAPPRRAPRRSPPPLSMIVLRAYESSRYLLTTRLRRFYGCAGSLAPRAEASRKTAMYSPSADSRWLQVTAESRIDRPFGRLPPLPPGRLQGWRRLNEVRNPSREGRGQGIGINPFNFAPLILGSGILLRSTSCIPAVVSFSLWEKERFHPSLIGEGFTDPLLETLKSRSRDCFQCPAKGTDSSSATTTR